MENSTLSIVILALVVYRWFPVTENNLLILVDSRTDDVTKLRSINSLISAFKIETNINTHWKEHLRENDKKVSCFYNNTNSNGLTIRFFINLFECLFIPFLFQWNLILVVRNVFTNDHGKLLRYLDYIRGFQFVNDISIFPYTSQEALKNVKNAKLYLHGKIISPFSSTQNYTWSLPEEDDLNEMEEYDTLCSSSSKLLLQNTPIFVVNLVKISDNEAYDIYDSAISNTFSMIGTRILSLGVPETDYWDKLNIIQYQTTATFCEILSSKELQDKYPKNVRGIEDGRTYVTTQVI